MYIYIINRERDTNNNIDNIINSGSIYKNSK